MMACPGWYFQVPSPTCTAGWVERGVGRQSRSRNRGCGDEDIVDSERLRATRGRMGGGKWRGQCGRDGVQRTALLLQKECERQLRCWRQGSSISSNLCGTASSVQALLRLYLMLSLLSSLQCVSIVPSLMPTQMQASSANARVPPAPLT